MVEVRIEVDGEGIHYFEAESKQALADGLRDLAAEIERGEYDSALTFEAGE